ncbi:MAG: esterase-like activity of phytase family protein [Chitinophagaceae bacterium]|nr:esterase-like activity of phytase family protein [Chitinophagaceae bacterium]
MKKWLIISIVMLTVSACGVMNRVGKLRPVSMRFLDMKQIPSNLQFENTNVRGLSGIDYNPTLDEYYIICDDRSERQPSRYYTAKIKLNKYRLDSFFVTRVDTLRNDAGRPFAYRETDPESIRYDATSGFLVWTSEGERTPQRSVYTQPTIRLIKKEGWVLDSFPLPTRFRFNSNPIGARDNGTLEGMSYTPDYRQLWLSVEEPLYEDGPRIDTHYNDSYLRFFGFDRFSKNQVGEYAYKADKVAHGPRPTSAYRINGISEMLFLDSTRILVMERSYSTGRDGCTIKIYLADFKNATDIRKIESLQNQPAVIPMEKSLLFNLDDLGRYIDNVEGICFGPKLPNGKRSIILVSDDNFSNTQETQLYLFELTEK